MTTNTDDPSDADAGRSMLDAIIQRRAATNRLRAALRDWDSLRDAREAMDRLKVSFSVILSRRAACLEHLIAAAREVTRV